MRMDVFGAALGCAAAILCATGAAQAMQMTSSRATHFEISKPAREIAGKTTARTYAVHRRINPLAGEQDHGARGTWTRGKPPLDPLASVSRGRAAAPTPPPDLVFDGTANPFACGGCSPPDANGDVSKKEYVQVVNATQVAVFKKNGDAVAPPFDLGALWSSGDCAADVGDPDVMYDTHAKRWVITQLANANAVCFAVSQTSDPLGAYYLYEFNVVDFPDYFKIGVWPDAYYGSANQSTYAAFAFNRAKMLTGDPSAEVVRFSGETNLLLPADLNDRSKPKGGGYFFTFKDDQFHGGVDRIELFRLTPDFANTANSTFELVKAFPIAPFTYTVCGFFNFDCIPQKDTTVKVDAVSEWPMQRFNFRTVGGDEELVGAFTVGGGTADPGAAVRWFELRSTNGGHKWKLIQEGTQDLGDGLNRFMGSIAMDQSGDIALGYSASGADAYPSIRYATRRPDDPLGTLGAEQILKAGGGSQTSSDRWGDYSAMAIDPKGECQFWYTNEYYDVSSGSDWKTAVGAFTEPTCGP